jgi:hypothetical protein
MFDHSRNDMTPPREIFVSGFFQFACDAARAREERADKPQNYSCQIAH